MEQHFTNDALAVIRREIERAGGREVLFFAWTGDDNRVSRVQVVARGTDECVAVPLERSFLPDVLIHNHPDGRLSPSEQDMRIASVAAGRGVGFFVVDNKAVELYVAVEPVLKKAIEPIDGDRLASLIGSGGPFSRSIRGFEEREGQKEMVRRVALAFNQDSLALIEAGTGIGKSVAYLLPAIEWAVANRERVVVSTHTINLQEQLIHKDIPDLKRALGLEFSHVLMKGRSNYVCLNRVSEIREDFFSFLEEEDVEQFKHILGWIEGTGDGSLSDLSFVPRPGLWEKVNSSSEMCLGGSCGFFGSCFVNRVKRTALTAHLVVTNHHYLLADASLAGSGASILPAYERVVCDEAHTLEDAASSFFTRTLTRAGVLRLAGRLFGEAKGKKGYLAYLEKQGVVSEKEGLEGVIGAVRNVKSSAVRLFDGIEGLFSSLAPREGGSSPGPGSSPWRPGTPPPGGEPFVVEMGDELLEHPLWASGLEGLFGAFRADVGALIAELSELIDTLDRRGEERATKRLTGFASRFGDLLRSVDIFTRIEGEVRAVDLPEGPLRGSVLAARGDGFDGEGEYARWLEKRREAALTVALVDVGSMLQPLLFARAKSAILTSATLTVGGSFRFIRSRLSLESEADEAVIPSPFRYDSQMAVLLPTDTAEPESPGYLPSLVRSVTQVLRKTQGKAFVLFTSYRTLNEVHDAVRGELAPEGYVVFKQGTDSRRNLLDRFKADIHSILFGTESFWEGVDVPGEALECVIITKLPFRVPTEPLVKARMERLRRMGEDPFLEYSLPQAAMKLKQGMGRLIRNRTDRGIVVILDRRIRTKGYGRVFIESMPGGALFEGPLDLILGETGGFLTGRT